MQSGLIVLVCGESIVQFSLAALYVFIALKSHYPCRLELNAVPFRPDPAALGNLGKGHFGIHASINAFPISVMLTEKASPLNKFPFMYP